MDRCYKLIALLLVLSYVLISTKQVEAYMVIIDNIENTSHIHSNENEYEYNVQTIKTSQRKEIINISNEDLLLLSKVVASEARGETYEGQVAVAAVVINRVLDPRFPDTIREVIYQRNAFSVVSDGSINMDPTEIAYQAALEALYGEDPTNQSVYFWNPDIATCSWIRTLSPHMRIGNHVFAK